MRLSLRASRTRIPALTLVGALLLMLAAVPAAGANLLLLQLSTDPYTNTDSQHRTEVEPDTYAYGSTIVSAFQVGRFTDGGSSDIGWAASTDNGRHWTHGYLPGITVHQGGGSHQRASDPAVAYDPVHNAWMIVSLPLDGPGIGVSVLVSRSTDGGLTWQNPVTVYGQGGLDKTWMVCDANAASPHEGNCYVEWDNTSAGNLLQMSTSTNGGLTWGPARAPADNASGLGGQPLVQPNGNVIVPYSQNYGGIGAFMSTNGGASWNSSVTVAGVQGGFANNNLRTEPLPSAEIDGAGKVYVVWQDCRFRSGCSSNDIVMSTSTNGTAWSTPVRIPIDPVTSTADHFIPGIGVDKTTSGTSAHLGLTYYYYPVANCSDSTCQLKVGFVHSATGGAEWTAPVQIAGPMAMSWLASTNQGYMVGDYISTSISADGNAHPAFAVAHAPSTQLDEAMYTTLLPLAVTPGTATTPAGHDRVVFTGGPRVRLPGLPPTAH